MSEDISGRGDPVRTLQVLWGRAPEPKRGPKARLEVSALVAAAIAIADAEGIAAVSTRRVAEAVKISPMSFYTYLPGKNELLDLMVDAVTGEFTRPAGETWRVRLEALARQLWAVNMAHPWLQQITTHRPVLGPNTMAFWDATLAAVDGIGLDPLEMDMVVSSLTAFVGGAVRGAAREKMVKEATGMSDEDWWYACAPFLETLDYSPYPTAARLGPEIGEAHGAHAPLKTFEFGLQLVLDGVEVMLAGRKA